jgi:hypothetical protein
MKFLLGKTEKISKTAFLTLKYVLSALSIALTTAFVVVLETRV